jgi:hypothetical protein
MRYRVLLGLEEPVTQGFYAAGLETAGFDVRVCSPAAAIRTAVASGADVVVIDGSRDAGVSACREFKGEPRLARVRLVALAPPDGQSALDRFCDAVLPIDCLPDALVETVDRLLATHSR